MSLYRRENGSFLTLGRELNAGGEGKIYAVVGEPQLVAKIYHRPTPERTAKLDVMLAYPPNDPTRMRGHISIAWPKERILDTQGKCVGFLMPAIDTTRSFPLLKLYNPQDRRKTLPGFTWQYLLRTARNFAIVLDALHKGGYVVGDLNESNILVADTALVTLVDCDSIQVRGQRQVFRCRVGKSEYTAPELQGCDFSQIDRVKSHDNFALAVLIFLLLMEGRHPFTGIWQGSGEPPTLEENIKARNCAYLGTGRLTLPRHALPFDTLPSPVRHLMLRSFTSSRWNPFHRRPRAQAWSRVLRQVEQRLATCSVNSQHVYSSHLHHCPWCQRMSLGISDPFPPQRNTLQLPPIYTTAALPTRSNRLRRVANTTFGCIIPLLLLIGEGILWYIHPNPLNQWFSHASDPLKGVIVFSVLAIPFLVSSTLRELLWWLRSPRRTQGRIERR